MSGGGPLAAPEFGVIYEPPREGCPYLVVIVEPDGIRVSPATSRKQAREQLYQWKSDAKARDGFVEIAGKDGRRNHHLRR
jgi:hypothetical protein